MSSVAVLARVVREGEVQVRETMGRRLGRMRMHRDGVRVGEATGVVLRRAQRTHRDGAAAGDAGGQVCVYA